MDELKQYRAAVEKLARERSVEVFKNGQPEHAAIILETFLKFAKSRVTIFCSDFTDTVFGATEFPSRLEAALLKGVRVDIIVQNEPQATGLVAKIADWAQRFPVTFTKAVGTVSNVDANFATMDGEAYRFEQDRSAPVATACMFNPRLAEQFEDVFFRYKASLC